MERAVPVLPGDDLKAVKRFYVDGLGFRVTFEATEDGTQGLIGLARGGLRLTIDCPMSGHGRKACAALEVDDADALYEEWRSRVPVGRPPKDEEWNARTFGVTDPSGNTIFVIGPVRGDAPAPAEPQVTVRSAVPAFLVADVTETARWYAANLGFRIAGTFPKEAPYAFASVMLGPAEIMLLDLPGYEKPDLRDRRPAGMWDAYIRVDGVRALYGPLEGEPFIQMPITHQPYGDWEFEVRDPNGYVVVFGGAG